MRNTRTTIIKSGLLLILFLAATSVTAQFRVLKSIDELEVLASPTFVTFGGEDWENNKAKIGYSAGIGVVWILKERASISTKLLTEGKGIKFSYAVTYFDEAMLPHNGRVTDITNLNYLTVPIAFRYYLSKNYHFLVEAGPYLSYLYKAQAIREFSWRGRDIYNEKDNLSERDIGLHLLLGYKIFLKNEIAIKFWVNASYGFTSIGQSGASGFGNANNETLGIGVSLNKDSE